MKSRANIYLATAIEQIPAARRWAHALIDHNFAVVSRWIGEEQHETTATRAVEDWDDLRRADAVVAVGDPTTAPQVATARAWDKCTILIGTPHHLAHELPAIERTETFEGALEILERLYPRESGQGMDTVNCPRCGLRDELSTSAVIWVCGACCAVVDGTEKKLLDINTLARPIRVAVFEAVSARFTQHGSPLRGLLGIRRGG